MKKIVFVAAMAATLVSATAQAQMPKITAPFSAQFEVDLGQAQAELQNTLNAIRKDDRCGDNWNVWDARVIPNGQFVKVDLHARYFRNHCVIIRRPYVHRDGWRITIRYRNEIVAETKVISQSGHIAVDVQPVIENGTISVNANVVTADLGGLLGHLKLDGQVKDLLNKKIREQLQAKLTAAIPAEVLKAGIQINEVVFVDLGGGKLGLKVKASGKLATG